MREAARQGDDVGGLYDDLAPWAAALCEAGYQDALSSGRRRRAARMDFVPGWKEAARQLGRLDVFAAASAEREPPAAPHEPAEDDLPPWAQRALGDQGDMSWVHDTKSPRLRTSGEGVPEGIFYPRPDTLSVRDIEGRKKWQAEALEAGRRSWRAIGGRQVGLAWRSRQTGRAVHALRTKKRGYGMAARHWEVTTECGQIMLEGQAWHWQKGPLRDATCLMCRAIVRERFEMDLLNDGPPFELYEDYQQHQLEEMWRIQAEWHAPDPVTTCWVGEGELGMADAHQG